MIVRPWWMMAGLVAGTAQAAPLRLAGQADVVQLCRHLTGLTDTPPAHDPVERARQFDQASQRRDEAHQREYEVRLPPRDFHFGGYDMRAETLDVGGPLRAGHGLLDLSPGEVALGLDAAPAEASQAYRAWKDGRGDLRVVFDLDDASTCEGSPASPPWLLPVRVLSLTFVGGDGQLQLDGANGLNSRQRPGQARTNQSSAVAVAPVVAVSGHLDAAKLAASVQHSSQLQQCYSRALGANPQLEGTVVFQARVDSVGHPQQLQVALEDLGSPELVGCLSASLMALRLPMASGASFLLPLELQRM